MLRRLTALVALVLALLVALASPAGAHVELAPGEELELAGVARPDGGTTTSTTAPASSTTADLPGTTLEAADDGDDDSAAPWLIGAGIAAVLAILVGGLFLKRKVDADRASGHPASQDQPEG